MGDLDERDAPAADALQHIKRVDFQKRDESDGDDEYCYTDSTTMEALDILFDGEQYYVVHTETYYSHSYDQYESPMNTYSEGVTLAICLITADMLDLGKEELAAYMKEKNAIWGHCDTAPRTSITEAFVLEQTQKALKKHANERRTADRKARGECAPNAILIAYDGEPTPIYIDDFTTNEGLAAALHCDKVTLGYADEHPEVGYFYNAKIVYGVPYNSVASSIMGHCLEGAIVTCARDEEGHYLPLGEETLRKVVAMIKLKKKMMRR